MTSVFGVSAGDFIATGILIKNLIQALRVSAASEHLELCSELDGLKRALHEIEHLKCSPEQERDVNAVKVAALRCRHPLEDFEKKLVKYWSIGTQPTSTTGRIVRIGRKVQWSVSMQDDVDRLRAVIAAHVGSLNMRLLTLGLNAILLESSTLADASTSSDALQREMPAIRSEIINMSGMVSKSTTMLSSLKDLVTLNLVPQLSHLTDFALKIWTTNLDILAKLSDVSNQLEIDLKHTHFQAQFIFEDASGNILPLPPELGWRGMNAIVKDRYLTGPGHRKIAAGEYELFHTRDRNQLITSDTYPLLPPGSRITMSLIIGRYEDWQSRNCSRPGCASRSFSRTSAGGWTCDACAVWFDKSHTMIPRPFRELHLDDLDDVSASLLHAHHVPGGGTKRRAAGLAERRLTVRQIFDMITTLRDDRKWFKNISVIESDLSDIEAYISSATVAEHGRPKKVPRGARSSKVRAPKGAIERDRELVSKAYAVVSDLIGYDVLDEQIEDYDTTFANFGFDSLLAVQLPLSLEEALGYRVTITPYELMSQEMTMAKFKTLILSANPKA
ncbi:hypothetical protein EJ05DRAFT_501898 [Pseudovirgaria hyperparasitica]|uniref:Uncharacterized protein n=1 Tax=Pseudovirgaria hyperparasitica TaxID=470096 RepID=A0A6A6W304_9PEZI|nr:uncharacterized protein EJ05DRAFT_501898 [Pseudovirgaria hyperparasitica]KAF2756394.1 hypothetical protein EJ05DRAFT_501898 [Pseudovirgaria hyperparasitica]